MKQITEDYCSYETAKLLKEKGFKEITQGYINADREVYMCPFQQGVYELGDKQFPYPTHQMALKWLREVHKFIVTIDYDRYHVDNGENSIVGYGYNIQTKDNPEDYYRISESVYDSYEEAVEAALLYVLKNLI